MCEISVCMGRLRIITLMLYELEMYHKFLFFYFSLLMKNSVV